uniref:Short neuropeptide F n=1 Tax=Steinernema glaseri TaxID=37863 RepID=A0A1I7YI65_9BILA
MSLIQFGDNLGAKFASPLRCHSHSTPTTAMMLLPVLLCFALSVEAIWPFSSSSSTSSNGALPGTQRIPQSFSGFIGNVPSVNHFDIEALTKNAAIRTNQETALLSQMARRAVAPNNEAAEILSTNVEVLMPRSAGGAGVPLPSRSDIEGDDLRALLQANAITEQTRNLQFAKLSNPLLLGGVGNDAGLLQLQRDFLLRQQLGNQMLPNSGSRFPFSDPRPLNSSPFFSTRKLNPIIPQGKAFVHDLESDNDYDSIRRPLQQPRPVRTRSDAFSDSFDFDSDFGRHHENRGIVDGISDGFGTRVPRNKLL